MRNVKQMYLESHRYYHNWQHIEECLALFDYYQHLAVDPDELYFAILYHDCVYISGCNENEALSATVAERDLRHHSVNVHLVSKLIQSTAFGADLILPDMKLMHDIDYAILAAPRCRYQQYAQAIRLENAQFTDSDYRNGRSAFLQKQLDSKRLFQTAAFHNRFDEKARSNIKNELSLLV